MTSAEEYITKFKILHAMLQYLQHASRKVGTNLQMRRQIWQDHLMLTVQK